jgi:hypothetical protein
MSKISRKFKESLESLYATADGEMDLRDNYKLYRKVYQFYKKEGAPFTGDAIIDYNMIVRFLSEDLF